MLKTLIVIPAYNEQAAIVDTVAAVVAHGFDYVVINDGSTDRTLEICKQNNINVVALPENLGIGGAVQTGHKYALLHGYDVDIQFDGDGQHDADYFDALIEGIEAGQDLMIGSRFIKGHKAEFQSSLMRRIGKNLISGLIKCFTGRKITDPTSGFRATSRSLMTYYAQNYPSDYPEPESIVSALKNGYKVSEIPVEMHERQGGSSSISPLKGVYYMIKVSLAIIINGFGGSR